MGACASLFGALLLALSFVTPVRASPFGDRLQSLGQGVLHEAGTLTASDVEAAGQAALRGRGRDRVIGLWWVMTYYRYNQNNAAVAWWSAAADETGRAENDPALRDLAAVMRLSIEGVEPASALWNSLEAKGGDVALAARLERVRVAGDRQAYGDAIRLVSSLNPDAERDPRTRVIAADTHFLTASVLTDLGDHQGALEHISRTLELDRQSSYRRHDSKRVYFLAYLAAQSGELDAADRLLAMHRTLVGTSGGRKAMFFNRYVCARVARSRGAPDQVLRCLEPMAADLDHPTNGFETSALLMRLEARAERGDVAGAKADLARVSRAPSDAKPTAAAMEELAAAHVLRAEGRDAEAFNVLDDWRKTALASLLADQRRKTAELTSALQQQLSLERDRADREAEAARLDRNLRFAWSAVAGLLMLVTAFGAAFAVQQRRLARQVARERLAAEAASKAKSDFLATMSHELRTPLNAVLGLASTLEREKLDATVAEQVQLLALCGRNMLAVLNDVLDVSKIEAGKLDLNPRPASLGDTCEDLARLYALLAEEKGVALDVQPPASPAPPLMFDDLRVRQCVSNLLSNAVKFTQAGRIGLSYEVEDRHDGRLTARICVTDTGEGVSPEALDRLFGAYEQTHANALVDGVGTGLGLHITRRLARLMGGDVEVISRKDEGSVFALTFVCDVAAESAPDEGAGDDATVDLGRLQGLRVLVADDHPVNRRVIRLMLEPLGCHVVEARDGAEAVEQATVEGFDLVLMDLNMPQVDGLEATRRLVRGRPSLMIIGLTADVRPHRRDACLAAGMRDVVAKPVELSQLVGAILTQAGAAAVVRAA
ncbi:response regulator [Caulobacter segnis]|uniref:hybrid sensor histidine kinase/response regulator n=1 Tax=Caulobacter segnis TaxID=88688 RepID=UPI0024100549|nr:response regulator [Caulobacter segnis]MDG2520417.1 response regulator [Caulobacter segnis]